MITAAEESGELKKGMTIVEPTSGNTGIALAFLARERGYKCILTMPETMSIERRMMLLGLGAEVVLTPKEVAVKGAVAKAEEIMEGLGDEGFMPQQFKNPANAKIHRETTGPEIFESLPEIGIFVSGVGTGGTVTGTSQYLKGCSKVGEPGVVPNLHVVAVEPREQMLITELRGGEKIGEQGPHRIQGMGAGIVPDVLDADLLDEVVPIASEEAEEMCGRLWLEEGLPVGVSAGAIVSAALKVLERGDKEGPALAIIPSFGERYFTHPMWEGVGEKANGLKKQALPEPFDNTDFGFETARG